MKGFNSLVDAKTSRISLAYAEKKGISVDEAMERFIGSATYCLLNDKDTGIFLEVFECVYDMFLEEVCENDA
ncbi:MAG: hypothetical protein FWC97_03770 [Treponema sp.]|nr:hypothetical protein [Treponema sp.]